jgi:hypothetical protein
VENVMNSNNKGSVFPAVLVRVERHDVSPYEMDAHKDACSWYEVYAFGERYGFLWSSWLHQFMVYPLNEDSQFEVNSVGYHTCPYDAAAQFAKGLVMCHGIVSRVPKGWDSVEGGPCWSPMSPEEEALPVPVYQPPVFVAVSLPAWGQ